jgi:hypothetical protein
MHVAIGTIFYANTIKYDRSYAVVSWRHFRSGKKRKVEIHHAE